MKSLVTGGAGFIGSNLVDKLVQLGHKVTVLDNLSTGRLSNLDKVKNKIEFINIDISSCAEESLNKCFKNIDCVFHLAAQSRIQPSIINPNKTIKINYHGTENILKASKKYKVIKLIYSSSSSVYGIKNKLPHKEDMGKDCLNPYAISKSNSEDMCIKYFKKYGLNCVILRYFNVYGERQPTKGNYAPIVGRFLKLKKEQKDLTIVGDGKQKRDYTHVKDVVKANLLAAKIDCFGGEIFNIGSGKNYSVLDLAKMINHKYIFIPKRDGEVDATLADINKAKDKLNWFPNIDIKEWLKGKMLS